MTKQEIHQLVNDYTTRTLDECEETRLPPYTPSKALEARNPASDDDALDAMVSVLGDGLADTTTQLMQSDYSKIAPTADELLAHHHITTVSTSSEAYQQVCRELLKAQQIILRVEMERLRGRYDRAGELLATAGVGQGSLSLRSSQDSQNLPNHTQRLQGDHAPGSTSTPDGLKIDDAIHLYIEQYSNRDERTNQEKKAVLKRFKESLPDIITTLPAVKKAHCVHFRNTYLRLPKRIPNMYWGKTITEVLEGVAVTHPNYTPVTKSTVNHALTDLHHFFKWALKYDHIEGRNPVDGIEYEGVKEEHYAPYTDDDLHRLFAFPEYQQQRDHYPARYWLPLILLYTGARREEIARLTPADVQQSHDGVYYFDILPDVISGKQGKNAFMKRKVPVHSQLIALGLLRYVAQATKQKWVRLLPKPQEGRGIRGGTGRSTSGDAVSKWFNRILTLTHIEGRKNLHSFRHTVVTRLLSAGVPQDIREILVGHASSTVHGQVYTHREEVPLKLLQSHLEKLDFPSITMFD